MSRHPSSDEASASVADLVVESGALADHARLRVLLERARDTVEALGATLALADGTGGLQIVATIGFDVADIEAFRFIAADADVPLAECVRVNARVGCEDGAERVERYPDLAAASSAADSMGCVPVRLGGAAVGSLGVAFRGARRLSPADWKALEDLAGSCRDLVLSAGAADGGAVAALGPIPTFGVQDEAARIADLSRLGLEEGEVGEAVDRLTRLAARFLGAGRAQVSLLGAEQIVASAAGFTLAPGARRTPLSESLCSVAVASGAPLDIDDASHHPWVRNLAPVREGAVTRYLGIPLVTSTGVSIGALCAYDDQAIGWSPDAKDVLADLTTAVVTELELRAADRQKSLTAARLAQLQSVTARLAAAATTKEIAEILVDQGMGLVAPYGVLGVTSADGTRLTTWATRTLPPELVHTLTRLRAQAPSQLSEAIRTGAPLVLQTPAEISSRLPGMVEVYETTGTRSAVAIPATVGGRVLGAIAFAFPTDHAVDAEVMSFAQSVTLLTAQALDRARLYEREHEAAHELQQALLPTPARELSGVRAAMTYRPADENNDVGGDWYDFFPLHGGRVGFAVGDIVGHDLRAAATMGRLHSVLRVIAAGSPGPAATLESLDKAVPDIAGADLATVGYGDYDPATRVLRYACAGHPPPLLILPGQGAVFLEEGRSEPLGIAQGPRAEASLEIESGALLLWYTDGLIERRGEDIGRGLERLQHLATTLVGAEPQEVCDAVIAATTDQQPMRDDIALLCLHLGTR